MSNLHQTIASEIERIESQFDRLKERLWRAAGHSPRPVIVPYRSFGNQTRMVVMGRVLEEKGITTGLAEDRVWQNLLNTYRRLESDEIANAGVEASLGGAIAEGVTDEEGYFRLWLEGVSVPEVKAWHEVDLRLKGRDWNSGGGTVRATAQVLTPISTARFGVISDIDDTVMQSHATELIRMAKLTFLGNASTRLPFPGVAAFYRALCEGSGAQNPLFYVSSSPWNLYDLIVDFFELQEIPSGPMFLRDWGISREEFLPTSHSGHKLDAIGQLFDFYEALPFILIGDSGQQDPEIYADVVQRYPERVLAVYIRDVSDGVERDEAVLELAEEVKRAGSTLILAENTTIMAQHAAMNGWIKTSALDDIHAEAEKDIEDDEPVL